MSKENIYILGLSFDYHDSAAALIKDGKVVAAAQEERFTREKQDSSLPENAIKYCLQETGVSINEVDYVGFYEKPLIKLKSDFIESTEMIPLCFIAVSNTSLSPTIAPVCDCTALFEAEVLPGFRRIKGLGFV